MISVNLQLNKNCRTIATNPEILEMWKCRYVVIDAGAIIYG